MTIPTTHTYSGAPRVPHNLTGDGTDYEAWTRELHEDNRVMRWDRLAVLFLVISLWFLGGWALLAFIGGAK